MGLDNIPEVLVLALMLVFFFAVFYLSIDFMYKIGLGALVFSVIFLTGMANQMLKQQKEEDRKRAR
jgi:protein-S-isoprenylcysteine O-methyltransferase Ste14